MEKRMKSMVPFTAPACRNANGKERIPLPIHAFARVNDDSVTELLRPSAGASSDCTNSSESSLSVIPLSMMGTV
jgi:hypothetical protein